MSLPPFTILGEVPNGGPGPDTARALRAAIPPEQVDSVLSTARDVILAATGPRDGIASTIDVRRFDQAIRVYMPLGHYARSPNQAISVMDYKMYACRVVHRLLNQIAGRRIDVAGAYTSHLATNARANALYDALKEFKGPPARRAPASGRPGLERDDLKRRATQQIQDRLRREMLAAERRAREEAERRLGEEQAEAQRRVRAAEQRLERERAEAAARAEEAERLRDDAQRAAREELEQRLRRELSEHYEQRLRRELEETVREFQARVTREEPVFEPRVAEDSPSWAAALADERTRAVFMHLAAHGSITEPEVIGLLGSPRAYRRFSLELEQNVRCVPFRVRIEPATDGKRYVKEGEN